MKTKKHLQMLLACGITAVLAVAYNRIAKYGDMHADWSAVLWVLVLTAGLFAFTELARFLFVKLCPKLAAGGEAHLRGITSADCAELLAGDSGSGERQFPLCQDE